MLIIAECLRRPHACVWPLACAVVASVVARQSIAGTLPILSDHAHVVYLNFADGTEGVRLGDDDDATKNISRLCAIERFARWQGVKGCGDRDGCREHIRRVVAHYYGAYDVQFTTIRPPPGTVYTMVLIAPPHGACTFGRRGVAFTDCGNVNPANIAFVFDCSADVAACAVLVAHELGHTFGLVHSLDDTDIMSGAPEEPALAFQATTSSVAENPCGVTVQRPHEMLLQVLGVRQGQ